MLFKSTYVITFPFRLFLTIKSSLRFVTILLCFHHILILSLFILYFPLSSSLLLFHAFYTLFLRSFLPFFCYSMLTFLCPPSRFHLGVPRYIRVYTGESFCSRIEMPCNYEARGKYHLSRDAISSWAHCYRSLLLFRGTTNELTPRRFYERFCRAPRQSIRYGDTQKVEGPAGH